MYNATQHTICVCNQSGEKGYPLVTSTNKSISYHNHNHSQKEKKKVFNAISIVIFGPSVNIEKDKMHWAIKIGSNNGLMDLLFS
jgi:hypothetical protein